MIDKCVHPNIENLSTWPKKGLAEPFGKSLRSSAQGLQLSGIVLDPWHPMAVNSSPYLDIS